MAAPKVFISSTCYDLMQIRDSLFEFVKEYYYEPVLSDKGDVFYHPDLHTHESCINEIENCQLFILIIGGRFGGKYKYDATKSITNAEYEAAKVKNIPVFTFIKRDVYEDHRLYQRNKKNLDVVEKIEFPSIENQEYALKIFEFINNVRHSSVNNGFFPFEFVNEIKNNLGKQWAGLMYDFLNQRLKYKDQKIVTQTLDNLTFINKKTEEIVENIYKQLMPQTAQETIDTTDKILNGARFYNLVLNLFDLKDFSMTLDEIANINPKKLTWYDYLAKTNQFELVLKSNVPWASEIDNNDTDKNIEYWIKPIDEDKYWGATNNIDHHPKINSVINLFEVLKTLTKSERKKGLEITTANSVYS